LTRLGIVVALESEARILVKGPVPVEGFHRLPGGTLLKLSGIGEGPSNLAANALVKQGATALLSWGSTGGLHPDLSPGSLVLPERVISPDQTSFSSDALWHQKLFSLFSEHIDLHTGPIVQNPTVLCSPVEKLSLFKQTGAIAVDMESTAVAEVSARERLPFVAIRSVVDPLYMTIPAGVLSFTDAFGRLLPLNLLKSLSIHPQYLFSLVQLGRNYHAAQNSLSKVLKLAGYRFLAP